MWAAAGEGPRRAAAGVAGDFAHASRGSCSSGGSGSLWVKVPRPCRVSICFVREMQLLTNVMGLMGLLLECGHPFRGLPMTM